MFHSPEHDNLGEVCGIVNGVVLTIPLWAITAIIAVVLQTIL